MSVIQLDQHSSYPPPSPAQSVADFLQFLTSTRERLKDHLATKRCDEVQLITSAIEEHYVDDQGKPAMYQQFESALYDDARAMVTLWPFFERFDLEQLASFGRMLRLEIEGLTGDRHPRKVFDRSPFGIAALVAGTATLWMTCLKTYAGENFKWLEGFHFNWVAGTIWIVGLFVVLWYILKTVRNNRQVAFLSTVSRSLELYLADRNPAHSGTRG